MDGRSGALLITSAPLPHIVGAFSLPVYACPSDLLSPLALFARACALCGIFPASQNVACEATSARCYIFSASAQSACTMFDFFIISPFVACEATSEAERCYIFSSSLLWSLMKRHFAMLKFFIISDLSPVKRHAPAERCCIFSASRSSQNSTPRRIGAEIRSFVCITARLQVFAPIASRNHVAEPLQPSPLATLNAHARTHARIYARF